MDDHYYLYKYAKIPAIDIIDFEYPNKNLNYWILEPIVSISHNADKLMGWNGGGDVRQQIKLKFSTLKNAEIYAKENGIILEFLNTHERSLKIKSYADNFIKKD